MPQLSLQTRFVNFIEWLRPDPERVGQIRKQSIEVKARIQARAEADGLIVCSTPPSGSFAKGTDLRRRMLDGVAHERQHVDCPFVIAYRGRVGDPLAKLLFSFERYAKLCYPGGRIERTKSSVTLGFGSSKINYELVPTLAVEGSDQVQVLCRPGRDHRRTSLQKHVEFIRERTRRSQGLHGPVLFNDAVRLVKWWREVQLTSSPIVREVPSFLLELLCAKAFDQSSTWGGYAETLMSWFARIQSYADERTDIAFDDYAVPQPDRIAARWRVIDPVNTDNNAVPSRWVDLQIEELRDWAGSARHKLRQAIAFDLRGRSDEALAVAAEIFGDAFRIHSEK
jgi:hypothetical protein